MVSLPLPPVVSARLPRFTTVTGSPRLTFAHSANRAGRPLCENGVWTEHEESAINDLLVSPDVRRHSHDCCAVQTNADKRPSLPALLAWLLRSVSTSTRAAWPPPGALALQVQCWRDPPCIRMNSWLTPAKCQRWPLDDDWPTWDPHTTLRPGAHTLGDAVRDFLAHKTVVIIGDSIGAQVYFAALCEAARGGAVAQARVERDTIFRLC